jgi:hypothetical protein
MGRRGAWVLLGAATAFGCAPPPAETPVPQEPAVVMESAAAAVAEPPVIPLAERIRQEGWLVRFWEQLNPAQRRRVTLRLRQNIPPLAQDEAEAAPIWDALGLPQRDALIFGPGLRGH